MTTINFPKQDCDDNRKLVQEDSQLNLRKNLLAVSITALLLETKDPDNKVGLGRQFRSYSFLFLVPP